MHHPQLIDLRSVKLCFQLLGTKDDKWRTLDYKISNQITDKKTSGELKIVDISANEASVIGGERIILLCDRVSRDNIAVVFYEEDTNKRVIWQEKIDKSNPTMKVHHQYAILFQAPAYKDNNSMESRKAFVKLYRPSDQAHGEPLPFEFVPIQQSTYGIFNIQFCIGQISSIFFFI